MIDADIRVDDPRWSDGRDMEALVREALGAAVAEIGGPEGEIAILFTDDASQRDVNRAHRGIDRSTNVLSFPAGETPLPPGVPQPLGDMSLAFETVTREAQESGIAPDAHLRHLIIHGFLHLLGYDHETEAEAFAMESLETRALARLGIPDPYGAQQV